MNPQLTLKISLAFNLLLVGVLGGQFLPARVPDPGNPAPAASRINPERRAAFSVVPEESEERVVAPRPATESAAAWSGNGSRRAAGESGVSESRAFPADFGRGGSSSSPAGEYSRGLSGSPSLAIPVSAANSSTQTPARVTGRMLGVAPASSANGSSGVAVGAVQGSAPVADLVNKVDPASPGNSIVAGSKRVGVEGYSARDEADGSLDLIAAPGTGAQTTPSPKTVRGALAKAGYSYEDELFRAKWGWAAFEQAQKLAKETNP